MKVLGLDACRGRWLGIVLDEGRFIDARVGVAPQLVAAWPDAAAIGVDIPIGLPETPGRGADHEARRFVGRRRSSVFATFPRRVLEAQTYDQAKAICIAEGWPKPSIQSFGMRHRILEIAPLAEADERLVEVHPEVSFRELFGRTLASKRTESGVAERKGALTGAGVELPDLPYPVDDVLDAAVTAWSAMRYARGAALPLPEGHRPRVGAIWR